MAETIPHGDLQKLIYMIENFIPEMNGKDEVWNFFFREKRAWTQLQVIKYNHVYFSAEDQGLYSPRLDF